MKIEPHVAAVLALLRSHPQLTDSVFEGDVTGNPQRYANVFHDTGFRDAHDALNHQVDVTVTFTIQCAGIDRRSAVWVSDTVSGLMLGALVEVPGRRSWRIEHAGSSPVSKDAEVDPPVWIGADRYTLRTTPA